MCTRTCGRRYEAWALLDVRTDTRVFTNVEVVRDFRTAEEDAAALVNSGEFVFNRTRECFVKSSFKGGTVSWGSFKYEDPDKFEGYNVAAIVFSAIGGFLMLASVAGLAVVALGAGGAGISFVFCIGVIIPLVILLPIRNHGDVSHKAQDEMTGAIFALVTLGCGPVAAFLFAGGPRGLSNDARFEISGVSLCGWLVPMGALLPAAAVQSRNHPDSAAGMVLYIVAFSMMALAICVRTRKLWAKVVCLPVAAFESWRTNMAAEARRRAEEKAQSEARERAQVEAAAEAKRKAEEEAYLKAHPEEAKRKAAAAERARFAEEERKKWGNDGNGAKEGASDPATESPSGTKDAVGGTQV